MRDIHIGHFPACTLAQAKQITRRKRKEALLSAPDGYTLRDAFKLWCGLKRGRIVSYQDERRRLERYLVGPIGSRQLDEITAPLVIHTVKWLDKSGKRATLKRVLMRTREILDLAVRAGFVFSGRKAGTHVSAQALAKHLHGTELKGKLVAHGLRSIARSWAADSSVPFEVAEACLSHVVGSQVSRAYQRSDFLEARRSVMTAWSAHIADCAQSVGMLDGFPWPERDAAAEE